MNILEIKSSKLEKRKLTMVTCYDFWSAKILDLSPINMLLVGDSSAMIMHGHADTIPATVEMISSHVTAVRKGAPKKFIVADLPFMAHMGPSKEVSVQALMQAGAQAIKLEGYSNNAQFITTLTNNGIPVMGHVGLTPQFVHSFGGFKVQGRELERRQKIIAEAKGLEEAGCFAIVLECMPSDLAAEVTSILKIPTIGIGAGARCDGQVLVLQDLLGLNKNFKAKFVRNYLDGAGLIEKALHTFHEDVLHGKFPSGEESY